MEKIEIAEYIEQNHAAFTKAWKDAIKNVLFYGVFLLIIRWVLVSLNYRTIAMILAVILAIMIFVGFISYVVSLYLFFRSIYLWKKEIEEEYMPFWLLFKYSIKGMVIRFFEEGIFVVYVLVLYSMFFVPSSVGNKNIEQAGTIPKTNSYKITEHDKQLLKKQPGDRILDYSLLIDKDRKKELERKLSKLSALTGTPENKLYEQYYRAIENISGINLDRMQAGLWQTLQDSGMPPDLAKSHTKLDCVLIITGKAFEDYSKKIPLSYKILNELLDSQIKKHTL